jgi:4-amino-4-deoxy-L-arabinose transferase-like glycosyltransferase
LTVASGVATQHRGAAEGTPRARQATRAPVVLGGAALLVAYLASRIWFMDRFPFYVDEGWYAEFVFKASRSTHDLFISYTLGREPLSTWLGIPFVELGAGALTAVRIVSMLSGLLTVIVIGLIGHRFGGARTGWIAAALCVVLPFFVVNHGLGTVEPLAMLIMAAALLLQIDFARRPDLRVAVALGLVCAAGTLTKESTKPALALIPASLLCFGWSGSDRGHRLRVWLAGIGIVGAMVGAALLLLRASSRYPELEAHRELEVYTVRPVGDVLRDPFGSWGIAWSAYRPVLLEYIGIPLLAAGVLGAVAGLRSSPRLTALLLLWIGVPLLIAMSFPTLPFPRHLLYVMPGAVVLMAAGLEAGGRWIAARMPARAALAVSVVALVLVLAPSLLLDWRVLSDPATARLPGLDDRYVTGTAGGAPWPSVADAIRRRARPGAVAVVDAGRNAPVLGLLLGPDSRYALVGSSSPLARRAQFVVTDELPRSFIDRRAAAMVTRGGFRLAGTFPRPRDGATVRLYER